MVGSMVGDTVVCRERDGTQPRPRTSVGSVVDGQRKRAELLASDRLPDLRSVVYTLAI